MARPPLNETLQKVHIARCRICGQVRTMTREHVPPRKAMNDRPVLIRTPETIPFTNRVKMSPAADENKGIFHFTLCEKCNNVTGSRYGPAYVDFIRKVSAVATPANANRDLRTTLPNTFPLRIVKQVTSMMLSTSKPSQLRGLEIVSAPGVSKTVLDGISLERPSKQRLREIYEELRLFVKRRDQTNFPNGVRLYMHASVGKRIGFSTDVFASINLKTRRIVWAVATGLSPVHWIFTFDSELDEELLDVTDWASYEYKRTLNEEIEIPMRWLEGHYPLDFRSPNDRYVSNFINSLKIEGFVPTAGIQRDQILEEAFYFARTLGKLTPEGYLISEFGTGTFYEFQDLNAWLEGGKTQHALLHLANRLEFAPDSTDVLA